MGGRGMIARLALRSLSHRKRRSLFLLVGYGLGVGVMIVLLAIGEALLSQARDEKLVGGGTLTVLPEGLDVEVMKTGGVGGLFFSIDRARFVYRQLLASPRLAGDISVVAPQIDGKLLYLRSGAREIAVRATGEIPSRSRALGSIPAVASGAWHDDDVDRRWMAPTPHELYTDMDHFHVPPQGLEHPESWGEWHYFNVLSPDRRRWAFISFIVGGDVRSGAWGG
ncbi:MAG TPA: ABC transporter permease, partial [Gemmatimonadaceae bacterium]|nr:ABC transporter permease [Gemmatimonadaceae bacterium]